MRVSIEAARGCGYRQPGGLYLVAPTLNEPCPRLPLPVEACPCCGQGIKPARGWTWVKPASLFPAEVHGSPAHNMVCPLGINPALVDARIPEAMLAPGANPSFGAGYHRTGDRAGLIWIGEAFYKTPEAFTAEAALMGVSRRIVAVPRGFVVGETYVYLGHRKAIHTIREVGEAGAENVTLPGIITLFKPTAIEYILRPGEEDDADLLDSLEKRGIEAVKVIREGESALLPLVDDDEDED